MFCFIGKKYINIINNIAGLHRSSKYLLIGNVLYLLIANPLNKSVFIGPGAIQFTVMLNGDNSLARDLLNPSTPALDAM